VSLSSPKCSNSYLLLQIPANSENKKIKHKNGAAFFAECSTPI
jgi:hypothetical protein